MSFAAPEEDGLTLTTGTVIRASTSMGTSGSGIILRPALTARDRLMPDWHGAFSAKLIGINLHEGAGR